MAASGAASRAAPIIDRLMVEGLRGAGDLAVADTLFEALAAAGLSPFYSFIASDVLHPTAEARALRWRRGKQTEILTAFRGPASLPEAVWKSSPMHAIIQGRLPEIRVRLDDAAEAARFPVSTELREEGGTDYIILQTQFGGMLRFGSVEEVLASFATDRPGGFSDDDLDVLRAVMPAFTLALHAQRMGIAGRTLLATYLGPDAADRVLGGNIVRGQADTVHAVIWWSDLSDFTRISDTIAPGELLGLLNAYAETIVGLVEKAGGDVLKFIGDGTLAIFRQADRTAACAAALDAAQALGREIAALNTRRIAAGQPVTQATLALHVGEVLYGNFGGATRLDFTVLGQAVNETSRIAALCRSLDQRVIVSSAFADQSGARRRELVSLGRYALRGVGRPQELFTLDPTPDA